MSGYVYLASAYTHPDSEIMERRYLTARHALGYLLQHRIWAYSPIVHCHELAKANSLPKDHLFWQEYDEVMLARADKLLILRSDGWETSKGVAMEKVFAEANKIPWEYM